MNTYREARMGKQSVKRMCRRCMGAGERPEVVVDGMQVHLTMIPCRCLDGVIS